MSVMRAKKIILKVCASFAVAGFLLCATLIALSAHEAKMPELPDDGWQKFAQAIPEEVEGSLEGDLFGNEDEFAQAVARMSSGEYLASVMFDVLGVEFKSTLAFFFSLCALVIVAAVFGAVGVGSENSSL